MDPLSLILLSLSSIGTIIQNPVLGGGSSHKASEIVDLLAVLSALILKGHEGMEELKAFAAHVKTMADDGRAPNRSERDAVAAQVADSHRRLQQAKERILRGESPIPDGIPDDSPPTTGPDDPPLPEVTEE